jgi:broad specificity phosphatase PhoE
MSGANEEGIIVSDPAHGVLGYGLTNQGREEVRAAAMSAPEHGILDKETIIFFSDFSRTKETAEIVAEVLGVKKVTKTPKLRERFFGDWEKMPSTHYDKVWNDDKRDHTHKNNGVESVSEVLERVLSLINDIEEGYSGKKILLVSHGDTLQILQTAFENSSPSAHRMLLPLQTAEIRKLNCPPSTLHKYDKISRHDEPFRKS